MVNQQPTGLTDAEYDARLALAAQSAWRNLTMERANLLEARVHRLYRMVMALGFILLAILALLFMDHDMVKVEPIRPTADAALVAAHYSRRAP